MKVSRSLFFQAAEEISHALFIFRNLNSEAS